MGEALMVLVNYLDGKSVYPAFRRILNLLFNVSITSFIYEKFIGKYTWLNYNNYEEILDFFIKGNFFIPFSLFVVVYSTSQFFSFSFFYTIKHFISLKIERTIVSYQFEKETIDEGLKQISKVSKFVSPIKLTRHKMLEIYKELRNQISPEALKVVDKELKGPKQNLEANFILSFRMIIAITIYFFSLPQFGWFLFAIAMFVLIVGMIFLMVVYSYLDIISTLLRKFLQQAEKYVEQDLSARNSIEK
jgi:hypothetical protein